MYENKNLRDEFDTMQNIYVFEKADRLSFDEILEALSTIKECLLKEQFGS